MDDKLIIELYLKRDEKALSETECKYGKYLYSIANRILNSNEDSLECVNDTYYGAWDTIPPNEPTVLSSYLGKITRNLAINRYIYNTRDKRNKNLEIALSELEDCLPCEDFTEEHISLIMFKEALNTFLRLLPFNKRTVFILRYWYLMEIKDIAKRLNMSQSNVKATLMRLREKLKKHLRKAGIDI